MLNTTATFRGCSSCLSYFARKLKSFIESQKRGGTNDVPSILEQIPPRWFKESWRFMRNHPRQWTTTVHFPAWLDLVRWSTSDLVDYTYTIYPQSMYFYHLLPLSALSMGKFRWSQQLSPRLVSHSIGVGFFAKASQTFMTEGDIPVPWTMGFFQSEHGRHFWRLFHIYVDVLLVFPMMSHFFP